MFVIGSSSGHAGSIPLPTEAASPPVLPPPALPPGAPLPLCGVVAVVLPTPVATPQASRPSPSLAARGAVAAVVYAVAVAKGSVTSAPPPSPSPRPAPLLSPALPPLSPRVKPSPTCSSDGWGVWGVQRLHRPALPARFVHDVGALSPVAVAAGPAYLPPAPP